MLSPFLISCLFCKDHFPTKTRRYEEIPSIPGVALTQNSPSLTDFFDIWWTDLKAICRFEGLQLPPLSTWWRGARNEEEMFPDFKTLFFRTPVWQQRFSLQNNIKTAARNRLSEEKLQNWTPISSAAPFFPSCNRRKVEWDWAAGQLSLIQLISCKDCSYFNYKYFIK